VGNESDDNPSLLSEGETVEFVCYSRPHWLLTVPWLVATVLVRRDLWITVKPV